MQAHGGHRNAVPPSGRGTTRLVPRVVDIAWIHAPSIVPESVASKSRRRHKIGDADDRYPCTVILTGWAHAGRGSERLRSPAASARVARLWRGRASKNLPQMKQGDARRCTPMGPCGSPVVRHAFGLQARLGGINQRAGLRAGRLAVIGAWHPTQGASSRGMRASSSALTVFSSTGSASSTRRSTKSSPTTTFQ